LGWMILGHKGQGGGKQQDGQEAQGCSMGRDPCIGDSGGRNEYGLSGKPETQTSADGDWRQPRMAYS
jgi:hypothetical protein